MQSKVNNFLHVRKKIEAMRIKVNANVAVLISQYFFEMKIFKTLYTNLLFIDYIYIYSYTSNTSKHKESYCVYNFQVTLNVGIVLNGYLCNRTRNQTALQLACLFNGFIDRWACNLGLLEASSEQISFLILSNGNLR